MPRTYARKREPSYRDGKLFDTLRTGNWASWDGAEQTQIQCVISLDDQVARYALLSMYLWPLGRQNRRIIATVTPDS